VLFVSGTALRLIHGFCPPCIILLFFISGFLGGWGLGGGKVGVVVSHIRVIVDSFLYDDSCSCSVTII
jgi:hypothetical protein